MRIPIKPITQKNTEEGCSMACLQMVLSYYGHDASYKEIDEYIKNADHNYISGNSYATDLARFANNKGLKVDCLAYNLFITDPSDSKLSKDSFIKKLEIRINETTNKDFKSIIKSTIKLLEEGVSYIIEKPLSLDRILDYVRSGIPVILVVNYQALFDKQGDVFAGHDIVLTGVEGNDVFFIDPVKGVEESKAVQEIYFAMTSRKLIAASCYAIAISK